MGFIELEQAGKRMFEQFPVIKRSAKRVYQLASVATSNEKVKSEGDVIRVSPDDGYEYFYGYYDKSPWDATDRYMICIKVGVPGTVHCPGWLYRSDCPDKAVGDRTGCIISKGSDP